MKNVTWIGCAPGNFRAGRPLAYQPIGIVVHVMEGTLDGTDRWFNDPSAKVSSHYGVGVDGSVHQYVAEQDTAFHAGIVVNPTAPLVIARPNVNPNFYTIGIEHEGNAADAWTVPQSAASAALVADIAARWDIVLDTEYVFAHHEVRASKSCPGSIEKVREILDLAIAQNGAAHTAAPPIQTTANVRIRDGAPSLSAPIRTVIPAGATIEPTGHVTGDSVQANSNWYVIGDGQYIWAGATSAPNPG
jgi:hypothetical protein